MIVQGCSHGGRDRVRGRDRRVRPGGRQGNLGRRHADRHPGLRNRAGWVGDREEHPRVSDRDADARAVVQGHDALRRRVRRVDRRPRRKLGARARLVLLRERDRGVARRRGHLGQQGGPDLVGPTRLDARRIRSRRSSARSPSRSSTASAVGATRSRSSAPSRCRRGLQASDIRARLDRRPGIEPSDWRRIGNGLDRRSRRAPGTTSTASSLAQLIKHGPASSGVYARFAGASGSSLAAARPGRQGRAHARGRRRSDRAPPRSPRPAPFWLITGTDVAGVNAAAAALTPARLAVTTSRSPSRAAPTCRCRRRRRC